MIPDSHVHWLGLKPVLFSFWGIQITSYALFMLLSIGAAILFYRYYSRARTASDPHSWTIILCALFFGSLGAKLMTVVWYANQLHSLNFVQFLFAGRSIVGGLLGGWGGVKLAKKAFGIKGRYGNAIAPALALGIAIGRLGCFFGSCCYGKQTGSRFGVDFGDGQHRHPTQLYEALFAFGLFLYLLNCNKRKDLAPGSLFRRFLLAYFSFRFAIEFIRIEPPCLLGLTIYQILSLLVIGLIGLQAGWAANRGRIQVRSWQSQSPAP